MNEEKKAVDFAKVYERELDEIVGRRRQANLPPASNGENARTQVSRDLVGVALSGGGVRSASFSLGLMQALYKKGILRLVDYLSTVSGGGYAGSCLSSLALHPETKFKWNVEQCDETNREHNGSAKSIAAGGAGQAEVSEENFPLAPLPDGRQPPRVVELIHGGSSLRRPLLFLNRYLIGVVLTNVVLMSVLFMFAAGAAFLFRCLDYRQAIDFLYALGFRGDIWRAFFPSYLLFIVWLLLWGISYWRKGSQATGSYARLFMTLTFVSVLLALAALLGTGDISLTYWRTELGLDPPEQTIHAYGKELKVVLVVLLLIGLLPYLRVKDLIRSGTKPKNVVEGWIFAIASRALLFGLPLLVFAYFAHENISYHNEKRLETKHGVTVSRLYDLVPLEIKDWEKTWREIELQAAIGQETKSLQNDQSVQGNQAVDPAVDQKTNSKSFAVSNKIWTAVENETNVRDKLQESLRITDQISASDRASSHKDRWLQMLAWFITGQQNDFSQQFERRKRLVELKQEICDFLTKELIQDPQLFVSFENIGEDFPEMTEDARKKLLGKVKALTLRGQGVQRQEDELKQNGDSNLVIQDWLVQQTTVAKDSRPAATHPALGIQDWLLLRDSLLKELTDLEAQGDKDSYQKTKAQLNSLLSLEDGQYAKVADEVQQVNWDLLKTYYGDRLAGKDTVFAMVVVNSDQITRLRWVAWSAVFFLLSSLVVSLNATSLHGFYRNRLSQTWITECPAFGRNIPLARLDTTSKGAPYHLLGASLHFLGRNVDGEAPLVPFLFSQAYCGSDRTGYVATNEYAGGRYDLPNAMSISGAAVTPTQVHNPLLAALLLVANSRLGQWLPNPAHRRVLPSWMESILSRLPPSPLRLAIGWMQKPEGRNYCFVADGGHTENLGLLELLRRRCKLIIVGDASYDPEYQFQNYVDLHRKVRSELGIRLEGIDGENVDLRQAIPGKDSGLAAKHFVLARIIYPPLPGDVEHLGANEGLLVLVKPNFTGDEPIDLQNYRAHQPAFPNHPTADQFYDPDRFESYRQLGFHVGEHVCDELIKSMRGADKTGNAIANSQFGWKQTAAEGSQADSVDGQWPEKLTKENFSFVIESLHCGDVERRMHAAHVIGESAPLDEKSRQLSRTALHEALLSCDGDSPFCEKVLWALGELQVSGAESRDYLMAVIDDEQAEKNVRLAALDALVMIHSNGKVRIRQSLKNLTRNKHPEIASRASALLEKFKSAN